MSSPPAEQSTTPSARERARLADALEAAGPGAPTLCTGWTSLDLAAHLVARERRLDSTPGLLLRPLAGWTEHVRAGYARRPYPELLRLIRTGPPATSPFALPGADAAGNLAEHFVHCEDVRRGDLGVPPRPAELPGAVDAALWRFLQTRGRGMFRRARTGVVLATPDGRETVAAGAGRRPGSSVSPASSCSSPSVGAPAPSSSGPATPPPSRPSTPRTCAL